jgi:hypothetical protein
MTIVRRDDGGHESVMDEVVFTDGISFAEFTISG